MAGRAFGRLGWIAVGLLIVAALGSYLLFRRRAALPVQGSAKYEDVVRHFYRGLATLEVGLLDDAKRDFTQATDLVPVEPAAWANLGLAHLRLGEFDPAAQALDRAATLAPANSEIAFLQGQMETSRGRLDPAMAAFRRAIQLDPASLRARYALAQEVERAGGQNADVEARQLLDEIQKLRPDNLAVRVERTRLAAKRADLQQLEESVRALSSLTSSWPAIAVEQYRALQAAATAASAPDAARATAFLRNVLVRVPAFREGLAEIKPPTELIAEPFTRFLRLPSPSASASPADLSLSFVREPLSVAAGSQPVAALAAFSLDGLAPPEVFAARASQLQRIGALSSPTSSPTPSATGSAPFPAGAAAAGASGIAVLDWNRDYKMDLAVAGAGGVHLLTQTAGAGFTDVTAATAGPTPPITADCFGVWAVDLEMDGDLDLVVGVTRGAPIALRNNGDGTWKSMEPFAGITDVRAFVWGDVDGDGDPDAAFLDAQGRVHVFENRQAGVFREMPAPAASAATLALTLGDVNADGLLDLVTLDAAGSIRRWSFRRDGWEQQQVASWVDHPQDATPGSARVFLADLDNNGALDIVASGAGRSRIWLGDEAGAFQPFAASPEADIFAAVDLNGDGRLDLMGIAGGEPMRWLSRGDQAYHWQVIRPRAQTTAGDQRINSFGIGGDIEIRSGLLAAKQVVTGTPVHFGLGTRTSVEVTRIVWPNGVMQADFDHRADEAITAEQRLKGSCPWVFADDGTGQKFVTDFLWRSPLGLRINAQDTAGVTQTEDRVKIRGDQLAAKNGSYDVRITAELWETHYIDHASLMVVDHPDGTEVFVDERFSRGAPELSTRAMKTPRAVARAWDQSGRDVTERVSQRDGRYLDTFDLGQYQGVATDHWVDLDLGREIPDDGRVWLVANGWIYPTDSSINVAIGQGARVQPRGLSLEAEDHSGRWVMVAPDLGFPAGKNKTILIDLRQVARAGVAHARRLRLRTNLEVYWDFVGTADGLPDDQMTTVRLPAEAAELRFRGFSRTDFSSRRRPEIPSYQLANVTQRWRDLVGYYTRFGDVRELIRDVDDRYVIMNAGDELRMSFRAPAPPAAGWTRDFVLVGDGWEKDGDYNTGHSSTVGPLPTHAHADDASIGEPELEADPIYRRYPQDWQTYHTRFVTPRRFLAGVR